MAEFIEAAERLSEPHQAVSISALSASRRTFSAMPYASMP
jgi:hypothetical protein